MTDTNAPTATARDLLGDIVTWDMGSQEIPLARIRQALEDAGLPEDAIGDLRTATAFARAVKELRENRTIDKIQANAKTGLTVFQFTTKSLDEARLVLDFAFEALCTLDTNTGDITCPESPAIETHARTMFAHALAHRTTSDVTRMVQRMFEKHADLYPINPRKGVAYFVPERFRGFSAQMEDFLSALGGSLLRFPVPKGTEAGNRSVRESVEAGLLAMAEELRTAREEWDVKTRGATMEHQVERLAIVAHKAESYAEYLMDRHGAVLSLLAQHKMDLRAKIEEITALKEAAKNAPDATGNAQQSLFSATRPDDTLTDEPEDALTPA